MDIALFLDGSACPETVFDAVNEWGAPESDQAFADDDEDRIAGLDMRFEPKSPPWQVQRTLAVEAKYEWLNDPTLFEDGPD